MHAMATESPWRGKFSNKTICKRKNQEKKIKECTDNVNVK